MVGELESEGASVAGLSSDGVGEGLPFGVKPFEIVDAVE